MSFVTSSDGRKIAFDKIGSGSPLILVDGALCNRTNGPNPALAALLQQHFTVYTYDMANQAGAWFFDVSCLVRHRLNEAITVPLQHKGPRLLILQRCAETKISKSYLQLSCAHFRQ